MNKLKLIFCFIILITFGCSSIEFVYQAPKTLKNLENNTMISVYGEDSEIIISYLVRVLNKSNETGKYVLSAHSTKIVEAAVIDKDATASKFSIKYTINYNLKNLEQNCIVFNKKIETNSSYDAKSAGYSFGTDISKKEVSVKTLHENTNKFLESLNYSLASLNC